MAYEPDNVFTNPNHDRVEMELFIAHKDMQGNGETLYYIGESIESLDLTFAVESVEKKTIAQRLPKVTYKEGGITFPVAFELMNGEPAYDALVSAGLYGLVDEEFDAIFLFGGIGVKESGVLVEEAPFAIKAKVKLALNTIGGAGGEKIKVTSEGKTTGDIQRGYMKLTGEGDTLNYDPDKRTWKMAAFNRVTKGNIGGLVIGGAAA